MTEQTQAEKLAAEVAKKWKYVLTPRLQDNLHIHVAHAITQATAELRAENERLKDILNFTQNQVTTHLAVNNMLKSKLDACETAGFDINDPHSHGRAISKDRDAYIKRVTELETERDQALAKIERLTAIGAPFPPTVERLEAQVSALVRALAFCQEAMISAPVSILPQNSAFWGEIAQILHDTQATADAYTAKVRREAIEECIESVENRINRLKHVESDRMMVIAAESALKNAKAELNNLLPEPAEKGGAS